MSDFIYTKRVQYVSSCGDIRWVNTFVQARETGNAKAVDFDVFVHGTEGHIAPGQVMVELVGDCQNCCPTWIIHPGKEVEWIQTGQTVCSNNELYNVEVNQFGDKRYINSGQGCGFNATLELPNGCFAFTSEHHHHVGATVDLEDCDGKVVGHIFPDMRPGATCEVLVRCGEEGAIIGYGVSKGALLASANLTDAFGKSI